MTICQKCEKNQGTVYDFYYGTAIEKQVGRYEDGTPKNETYYENVQQGEGVVCDSCIEEDHTRRVNNRKIALIAFSGISGVLLVLPVIEIIESYIWGIVTGFITFIILLMFLSVRSESGETQGDRLAIAVRRPDIGGYSYLTTDEYNSLKSDGKIIS